MSTRSTRPTSRAAREAAARGRQVQPRRNYRIWLYILGGLAALLVLAGVVAFVRNRPVPLTGVQTFSDLAQSHVEGPVTPAQIPPVGGPHNATWLNCGIYDEPVPNENVLHALEHGAVWITYRPDLPEADVEKLRALVRGHSHGIVSPYPDLPSPVVAAAWGVQMKVDSASDPRLRSFVAKYEESSEAPEPGASCRRGIGSPIER